MRKNIHPKTQVVEFICATCGGKYKILSTNKNPIVNIDVCSNCHPFYKNVHGEQKANARNEKLYNKFNVAKEYMAKKPEKAVVKPEKAKKKIIFSIDDEQ